MSVTERVTSAQTNPSSEGTKDEISRFQSEPVISALDSRPYYNRTKDSEEITGDSKNEISSSGLDMDSHPIYSTGYLIKEPKVLYDDTVFEHNTKWAFKVDYETDTAIAEVRNLKNKIQVQPKRNKKRPSIVRTTQFPPLKQKPRPKPMPYSPSSSGSEVSNVDQQNIDNEARLSKEGEENVITSTVTFSSNEETRTIERSSSKSPLQEKDESVSLPYLPTKKETLSSSVLLTDPTFFPNYYDELEDLAFIVPVTPPNSELPEVEIVEQSFPIQEVVEEEKHPESIENILNETITNDVPESSPIAEKVKKVNPLEVVHSPDRRHYGPVKPKEYHICPNNSLYRIERNVMCHHLAMPLQSLIKLEFERDQNIRKHITYLTRATTARQIKYQQYQAKLQIEEWQKEKRVVSRQLHLQQSCQLFLERQKHLEKLQHDHQKVLQGKIISKLKTKDREKIQREKKALCQLSVVNRQKSGVFRKAAIYNTTGKLPK